MITSGYEVELQLPPRPEYVGTARIVAAAFARHHGFGEEQIDDLKIAVSEAVTNAIRAHAEAANGGGVKLGLGISGDEMRVAVADRGHGFDPGALSEVTEAQLGEGGLGLAVIRSLFAETMIERRADGGMLLRFSFKRESEPAAPRR